MIGGARTPITRRRNANVSAKDVEALIIVLLQLLSPKSSPLDDTKADFSAPTNNNNTDAGLSGLARLTSVSDPVLRCSTKGERRGSSHFLIF